MTAGDRDGSLDELAAQLWPAPFEWRLGQAKDLPTDRLLTEFVVTPNLRSPRLVLPMSARAARRASMAEGFGRPLLKRTKSAALALTFGAGLASRLFPDRLRIYRPPGKEPAERTIDVHLAHVVGSPVHIAFQVTRARANRKPVLRLLDRGGRTLAFVKVGGNDLTRELVRTEGRVLESLASVRLAHTSVPAVISSHRWNDLELLVLAPLPVQSWTTQPRPAKIVLSACELATATTAVATYTLRTSDYWRDLRSRVAGLQDSPHRDVIVGALASLDETLADLELPFSAWHGDWAPWNFAANGDRLLVWDFERYRTGVPMGFDSAHYAVQTRVLSDQTDPLGIIVGLWEHAGSILAPMGLTRAQSDGVFVLYLAEISTRWVADRQAQTGDWSVVLDAMLGALTATSCRLAERRAGIA